MAEDDKLLIRTPPEPEPSEKKPHRLTVWLSIVALLLAAVSALYTGLQAHWARVQAEEAHQARIDAKTASDAQAKDVERSRAASESSATAAGKLAGIAEKSLNITQDQARLDRQQIIGTQAPKMRFSARGGGDRGWFFFQAINDAGGRVAATNVVADITLLVRKWPEKTAILRQEKHLGPKTIPPSNNTPAVYMDERFFIAPPDIWNHIIAGDAFVQVDWRTHYNNGFGEVIRAAESKCSVYLSEVNCPKYRGSFAEEGACSEIGDTMARAIRAKQEAQSKYCQANE